MASTIPMGSSGLGTRLPTASDARSDTKSLPFCRTDPRRPWRIPCRTPCRTPWRTTVLTPCRTSSRAPTESATLPRAPRAISGRAMSRLLLLLLGFRFCAVPGGPPGTAASSSVEERDVHVVVVVLGVAPAVLHQPPAALRERLGPGLVDAGRVPEARTRIPDPLVPDEVLDSHL